MCLAERSVVLLQTASERSKLPPLAAHDHQLTTTTITTPPFLCISCISLIRQSVAKTSSSSSGARNSTIFFSNTVFVALFFRVMINRKYNFKKSLRLYTRFVYHKILFERETNKRGQCRVDTKKTRKGSGNFFFASHASCSS